MQWIGRIMLALLAIIGGVTVLAILTVAWTVAHHRPQPLRGQLVLTVNLDDGVVETSGGGPLARLTEGQAVSLPDLVTALERAAVDPNVKALVVRLGGGRIGMAQAQDIREAVLAFRKSGKRTVAYSAGLGDGSSGGSIATYLASAFQEVWLQPSADVGLAGFMAQSPFVKGTLDLLGVKPEFAARWEYKSAIDTFTQTRFTKENRASLDMLLASWTDQAVDGIAQGRKLTPQAVRALLDRGPLMADEALKAGLVDRLAYWDELEKSLTEHGARFVGLDDYAARLPAVGNAVRVALITGVGAVRMGGDDSPFAEDETMSVQRLTRAFRAAIKDPSIKAILFRIDSPGGSYTAADAIWRVVSLARAAGKPVVVSMGDVAASGGYFVGMAADRVVAEPGTITGSIGVFAGKIVLADLWGKLGVNWGEMNRGDDAGMWSMNQPFTPQAWERVNAMLDHIYADFTTKAEQGRHIPADRMDALARGRVWSGADAKAVGLVDELGGFDVALGEVRKLVKLAPDAPLRLKTFPRPKGPLEMLAALFDGAGHDMAGMRSLTRAAQALGPLAVRLQDVDPRVAAELRLPAGMVPALHQGGTP